MLLDYISLIMYKMNLKDNSELQNGKYQIKHILGQGGFGITYLAEHTMLDKMVAIKEFFPKEYCDRDENTSHVTVGTKNSAEIVEMLRGKFIKEAKNISKLRHPNIITIHDIFQENGTAYYVMEYVEGASLSQMVKEQGAFSEEKALGYIRKIADAVSYMHSLSMNHLDLKPANIMVRASDDEPILIDFGLSKQYDASGGQTSTTPVGISHGFAPIEQYRPGGVATFTPQTDVYALGATLYNLLSGEIPPHYSDILEDGLPKLPPAVSQKVTEAIEHAMEVKKNKRPSSIQIFLEELAVSYQKNDEKPSPSPSSIKPVEQKTELTQSTKKEESFIKETIEETVLIPKDNFIRGKNESKVSVGKVNDVKILPKAPEKEASKKIEIGGIEFVDLGLSVLWANKNIGARTTHDIGNFLDKTHADDLREVFEYNLNGAKIPTIAQWEELRNQCSWECTELNGTGGYQVKGKNGNSIFLPFSGNEEIWLRTFGRLFTLETFYKTNANDSDNYYFYFNHAGTYKSTKYGMNYKCPVRLTFQP